MQKKKKKCLSRIVAKLWNEISGSLRDLLKKSFKLRFKNKLLSVLEYEDFFIAVHKIISKLKYQ